MPTYRINKKYYVEAIFEIEASSKREAKSMFLDKDNSDAVYVGETQYESTGEIHVYGPEERELQNNANI